MDDGIVIWIGLTARGVDLEARLQFEVWEAAGFEPLTSLEALVSLRHTVPEYMPPYILAAMKTRGV